MRKNFIKALTIATIILCWQVLSNNKLLPIELSNPLEIANYLYAELISGYLFINIFTSLWRIVFGATIGITIGITLGLLTGRISILNYIITPIINILRSLPPVALLTIFVALWGGTDKMRISAIIFTSIFNVYINTHTGAASIPIEYVRNAKLLTDSQIRIFLKVILPYSIQFIYAGVRLSIATAFIVAYVGETAGAFEGIGFAIVDSQNSFLYAKMMGYLLVLGIVASVMDYKLKMAFYYFFPWLKQ